jgi:hypothetical protein
MRQVAGRMKLELAQYRELAAFSQFASDLDKATRDQLERGGRLTELLKQAQYSPMPLGLQVAEIWAGTNGLLDQVPIARVKEWEEGFARFLRSDHKELLSSIESKKALDDDLTKQLEKATKAYNRQFGVDAADAVEETDAKETKDDKEPKSGDDAKAGGETKAEKAAREVEDDKEPKAGDDAKAGGETKAQRAAREVEEERRKNEERRQAERRTKGAAVDPDLRAAERRTEARRAADAKAAGTAKPAKQPERRHVERRTTGAKGKPTGGERRHADTDRRST